MTKAELIKVVAEKTKMTQKDVKNVLDVIISSITEHLLKGERVAIPDLGVFNVKKRKARKGRNPKTGKEIKIPEREVVVFSASKRVKAGLRK